MKYINGYDGLYSVTEKGEIFCHQKSVNVGSHKGIDIREEKWLNQYNHEGYKRVYLSKNGVRSAKLVHRIVAESFIPNDNNLPCVNHKDGNKQNNNVDNLEWCTVKENAIHAYKNGLLKPSKMIGELNGNATLTKEIIKQIRAMYAESKNASKVARHFLIHPKHAYDICHYRLWKHID